MKKLLVGTALATALLFSAQANATDFNPGDPEFQVFGDITNGTVSATIGNAGIAAGVFTDRFIFTLDQNGTGSGSVATSASIFQSVTDLDLTSVSINGIFATRIADPMGLSEFYSLVGVPIIFGVENIITVSGVSRGNGSYGGNLTFEPGAIPEASTWAMMIIGFGMTGAAMRYRRRRSVVKYAL
ncbi:FxDxF family PEP-CTERM protein [Sphingomonas qilianensis]|uniref:FxDxF family PEP-CTERM protein n=1 Tax=Sphingomonas qilianensis TaxID=1736690 RepID=A0ABU9XV86_9SPHN